MVEGASGGPEWSKCFQINTRPACHNIEGPIIADANQERANPSEYHSHGL